METGIERAIEDTHPRRYDHGSPNATSEELEKLPFRLQHGETIIRELKPQFFGFMITRAFGGYTATAIIALILMVVVFVVKVNLVGLVLELTLLSILIAALLLLISVKPLVQYGKSWYWITNHRVIGKRGFLGYSINSIPLENVSDVVLTRTLLDRLLGLSSLVIVSMGNDPMTEGNTADAMAQYPNFFPALTQETARELQRVLFNLRDDLKAPWRANSVAMVPNPNPVKPAPQSSKKGATQASIQPRRVSSTK